MMCVKMPTSAFLFGSIMVTAVDEQIRGFVGDTAVPYLCGIYFRSGEITKAIWGEKSIPGSAADVGARVSQAIGLCPEEADKGKIFGNDEGGIPFPGGQCVKRYNVVVRYRRVDGSFATCFSSNEGPILGTRVDGDPNTNGSYVQILSFGYGGNREPTATYAYPSGGNAGGFQGMGAEEILDVDVVTFDGSPDNCGDHSGEGSGQIGTPPSTWPDPDPAAINKTYVTNIDYGGDIGVQVVNLPFSNFKVDKLFPLDFDLDVGGVTFEFNDGDVEDVSDEKDKQDEDEENTEQLNADLNAIKELLADIRECTCSNAPEIDEVFLARAECSDSHEGSIALESILAVRGSVDVEMITRFQESAQEAKECCENNKPPKNKNAEEIFSGICTLEDPVVFSPEIGLEVMSVVLEITNVENPSLRYYKLAGAQSEAKFGHLGWTTEDFSSDSDGVLCWSLETYYSLPGRTKLGRVRISLKHGLSFTLWDSGERGATNSAGVAALSMAESEASIDNGV